MRDRDARIVGAVIGVGTIAGVVMFLLRSRPSRAAVSVSPRERTYPPPREPVAMPPREPVAVPPREPVTTRPEPVVVAPPYEPYVPPVSVAPAPFGPPPTPSVPPTKITTKTEAWRLPVLPFAVAADVPVAFALGWIQKESGGNPCSFGKAGERGPDGHPREQGIGQLYNPDDMKRFGVAPGAFRAYCKASTQVQTRDLTYEEILAQAKALIQLISHSRTKAEEALRKTGTVWSAPDYWKLVKLVHALPGLVKHGVPNVASALGRAPRDWWEYKGAILGGVKVDRVTERYRKSFAKWFQNAEEVAANVTDEVLRRVA